MSCCSACAEGRDCSGGKCSAGELVGGGEVVGDNTARDIGRTVATVDQAIDGFWQGIKGKLGVYGEIIDVAHEARMSALRENAPEFYPPRPETPAAPPGLPPLPGVPAAPGGFNLKPLAWGVARGSVASAFDTVEGKVARMRVIVRAALDGDRPSRDMLRALKEGAGKGIPEARRAWKAAILLSQETRPAGDKTAGAKGTAAASSSPKSARARALEKSGGK